MGPEVGWHHIYGVAYKIIEGQVDGGNFLFGDGDLGDEEAFEFGEFGVGSRVEIGFKHYR